MNEKLWAGRFGKELDATAAEFNASLPFDRRMYREDITGSMAHAAMLGAQSIISSADAEKIIDGLQGILDDLDSGILSIDESCEDIHSFVEAELTLRTGDVGRRLHTARSRNDQVATDLRLYLRNETATLIDLMRELIGVLSDVAEQHQDTIMPGYTHLQRAQPIVLAHHLLAYCMMLMRDCDRFSDARKRMNSSPLGAGALAGVTYNTDRTMTAHQLGFDSVMMNSLDAVSDRDFCLELAAASAITITHLSRIAEELVLWSSWEFKFIELDDAFATGSSMMPQKKNPDMAELIRGKTGRVFGDLMALLTVMKGLPLSYNKDMQEDKESIFDSLDTLKKVLIITTPMIATMRINTDNMRQAAASGFINATDLADYLVKKGMPFRTAYKTVSELVAYCIGQHTTLEKLPLEKYRQFSELFSEDLYDDISLSACIGKRCSIGGAAAASISAQLELIHNFLA